MSKELSIREMFEDRIMNFIRVFENKLPQAPGEGQGLTTDPNDDLHVVRFLLIDGCMYMGSDTVYTPVWEYEDAVENVSKNLNMPEKTVRTLLAEVYNEPAGVRNLVQDLHSALYSLKTAEYNAVADPILERAEKWLRQNQ
jgi:hypothetical protein